MDRCLTIQYDTAKLEAQYGAIADSRWAALKTIVSEASYRLLGLRVDDPDELWQFAYRRCGQRDAAKSILSRNPDEATFSRHLHILAQLADAQPTTPSDLKSAEDKNAIALVSAWILDRDHPDFLKASLCFHSDRARAKMVYFLTHKAALSQTSKVPERDSDRFPQAEPERIRKLCDKLGLVSAEPRTIKDVCWRFGAIHFEPFQQAISKPKLQ